jgi:hypothetical protein
MSITSLAVGILLFVLAGYALCVCAGIIIGIIEWHQERKSQQNWNKERNRLI